MIKDWHEPGFFIGENDFLDRMEHEVAEFLTEVLQDGTFQSYDGARIHYYFAVNPEEKGAIVISHGFCEFVGKYHEVMYYFYQAGYSVFFIEHRGHGFSQRFVEDIDKVYVKSFDEYIGDFKVYLDQIVKKKSLSKRYLLYAHSMGGAIGALFLERYPTYFERAVLSSPMMKLNTGGIPDWQVKVLMVWCAIARWQKRYVPGQKGFDNVYVFDTSSALSRPRYDYVFKQRQQVPEYRIYGGCYAWTRAALKCSAEVLKKADQVNIPVLLFQAGNDSMVLPEPQEEFVEKSKNTRMIRFPESKHEIFNALEDTRREYYQDVFTFFEEKK